MPDVVQVPSDDVEALARLMAERSDEVAAVDHRAGAGRRRRVPAGRRVTCRRCAACATTTARCSIFDEVITGFGRLGTWFGADHYGVMPDITTFAKGVTSGYQPLGGVLVGPPCGGRSSRTRPTCCARLHLLGARRGLRGGLANLAIMEREGLLAERHRWAPASATGCGRSPPTGRRPRPRRRGVWAVGMTTGQDAMAVRDRMLELGVDDRAIADHTNTFCPPLVTTDAQIDRIVDAVATAVTQLTGGGDPDAHAVVRARSPATISSRGLVVARGRRGRARCRGLRRGGPAVRAAHSSRTSSSVEVVTDDAAGVEHEDLLHADGEVGELGLVRGRGARAAERVGVRPGDGEQHASAAPLVRNASTS